MEELHSASWYLVAGMRPRASRRVEFVRHSYRGQLWYVSRDPIAGQAHRISPAAYALVSLMDGARTTDEIWREVATRLGDDAPTQDETIWLLSLLHGADLLRCDVEPDTGKLFERIRRKESRERRGRWNPISIRVPLLDPDAFLSRWQAWARPVFGPFGAAVWLAFVLAGALAALRSAPEIAAAGRSVLEPASLMALWLAYPLVKTLHELGHAFAVKRWGGEVHEVGVIFMVFVPVPYVDASAASAFPSKLRRMVVGAAGIAVELFLAATSVLVFLSAEPGLLRHVAYAVMLIGGVSTLLFNGNPLLRFDGYYVLADFLEIPNLAARANRQIAALARRFLLGMQRTRMPECAPGEVPWLVAYGVSAFVYRIAILLTIALFLARELFVVGVALALVTLTLRVVVPIARQLTFVLTDPAVGERRARAVAGALAGVALLGLLVFVLPVPLNTRSEGVVWLPEHANVRAGGDGFVVEVLAPPHSRVEAGDALVATRDPSVESRVRVLEAEQRELVARVHALARDDRVQAEIAREQLAATGADLARARERLGAVLIRSPAAGTFVPVDGRHLVGRMVRQGEVVGHVVDMHAAVARVIVRQDDIGLLRERTEATWVRLAHDVGRVLPARIEREVPAAQDRLPSPALGTAGGGPVAVDPTDPDGLRTFERVFQFDVELPAEAEPLAAGQRVYVRFDHGSEPIGAQAWRALRRVFLRQLSV